MSTNGTTHETNGHRDDRGAAQAALDLIAEARERGARAATDLARQITHDIAGTNTAETNEGRPAGAASPLRSLRREIDLALDEVSSLLRGAMDSAESVAGQRTDKPASIESLEISVIAGGEASSIVWIHNTTSQPWSGLTAHLDLAAANAEASGLNVTLTPSLLTTLAAQNSISVVVKVDASTASPGDQIHGLLMVSGADRVVPLHVRIVTTERGGSS